MEPITGIGKRLVPELVAHGRGRALGRLRAVDDDPPGLGGAVGGAKGVRDWPSRRKRARDGDHRSIHAEQDGLRAQLWHGAVSTFKCVQTWV